MIRTPYGFEAILADQEFQKIGQFACRWALIDHNIGNTLRSILKMDMEGAIVMIFPLNMDTRMARIDEFKRQGLLKEYQSAVFAELRPLVKAMQYIRNTVLHGIVVSLGDGDDALFHLRSKRRNMTRQELFSCEDLINYTAHVALAFRLSMGEDDQGSTYALPDRPPIPTFLPPDCRALPQENTGVLLRRPKPSEA